MSTHGRQARIMREVETLKRDPPEGISAWRCKDDEDIVEACIIAPSDSFYANGTFIIDIKLSIRYPFEPPNVRFKTKIFHPNVDETGRICLDSLKLPPGGTWRPSLNISQILQQLRILLVEPGLSDPLMKDIAELYKNDRERFASLAAEWTRLHATSHAHSMSGNPCAKRLKADGATDHESLPT